MLAQIALVLTLASACGGSSSSTTSTPSGPASSASATQAASSSAAATGTSASALVADAVSAATGDIPDGQTYLTYTDSTAGWSMRYPEGWAQQGTGSDVTFRAKNNLIHVVITHGATPSIASVVSDLNSLRTSNPSLKFTPPVIVTIASAPVIKLRYSTQSAPNPVTGKQVVLLVDRYVFSTNGRVAAVDLAAPVGVDNIDAYKMLARSFQWK